MQIFFTNLPELKIILCKKFLSFWTILICRSCHFRNLIKKYVRRWVEPDFKRITCILTSEPEIQGYRGWIYFIHLPAPATLLTVIQFDILIFGYIIIENKKNNLHPKSVRI